MTDGRQPTTDPQGSSKPITSTSEPDIPVEKKKPVSPEERGKAIIEALVHELPDARLIQISESETRLSQKIYGDQSQLVVAAVAGKTGQALPEPHGETAADSSSPTGKTHEVDSSVIIELWSGYSQQWIIANIDGEVFTGKITGYREDIVTEIMRSLLTGEFNAKESGIFRRSVAECTIQTPQRKDRRGRPLKPLKVQLVAIGKQRDSVAA